MESKCSSSCLPYKVLYQPWKRNWGLLCSYKLDKPELYFNGGAGRRGGGVHLRIREWGAERCQDGVYQKPSKQLRTA